jgi:hypothetical protein
LRGLGTTRYHSTETMVVHQCTVCGTSVTASESGVEGAFIEPVDVGTNARTTYRSFETQCLLRQAFRTARIIPANLCLSVNLYTSCMMPSIPGVAAPMLRHGTDDVCNCDAGSNNSDSGALRSAAGFEELGILQSLCPQQLRHLVQKTAARHALHRPSLLTTVLINQAVNTELVHTSFQWAAIALPTFSR